MTRALTIALVLLAGSAHAENCFVDAGLPKKCFPDVIVVPSPERIWIPAPVQGVPGPITSPSAPATQADIAELRAAIERLNSLIERDQGSHAK